MRDELIHLTDTLKLDSRALKVLTFEMKDGTVIRSDRLVFVEAAIDVIRDIRPVYSGSPWDSPWEKTLVGYLPPLATGEINLRFRLLADTGGNLITMTKLLPWWQRLVWKVGYASGFALGLLSKPKNQKFEGGPTELKFKDYGTFDWEEWTP